ncbi:hypothetical protein ACFV23_18615 [Streptomyces sp. NPDC059627]
MADAARRPAAAGQGRTAGCVAPAQAPGEVGLLALWGAFIALVDDRFDSIDRLGQPSSPAGVQAALDAFLAVLEDTDTGMNVLPPAAAALRDLWRRTCVGIPPAWCACFAAAYAAFAGATNAAVRARWRALVTARQDRLRGSL